MSVETSELIEAVEHLPAGGTLTLYGVGWEEYEELLEQLSEYRPGVRVSYNNGKLEIVTPSLKHEKYKGLVHHFILALSEELDRDILCFGSTTLKIEKKRKGTEPDECFYIEHAAVIAGKEDIDIRSDPPPDLAVEIDVTTDSSMKLSIYADFGVPEVWRYDGERFSFWQLTSDGYVETPVSLAFPFLSPAHLAEFISNCEAVGHNAARNILRDWVRTARPR